MTNFSSVFLIPTFNHATTGRLNKVYNKKIEGQDFDINFEVWVYIYFRLKKNCPCYCIQYIDDSN